MFNALFDSLLHLLSGWNFIYLMLGVSIGLVFGILPALGGSAAMAVTLPFVFGMQPSLALPMMIGLMAVTPTADTFSSVLLGIPGGNSSQSTVLDGFPMSKRGEAARALSASFTACLFGGLFGALILSFAIFFAKPLLLMIGFGEQMMLVLLAMTMVGTLAGRSPIKGVASCGLGLLLGMVGTAPMSGVQRLTMDTSYLLDGIPLPIVALGLFAMPEIIDLVRRQSSISETGMSLGSGWLEGVKDVFRNWGLVLRCASIGVFVGALPGLGGSVINWMAYGHAVQSAKDKSQFGKGDVRGVLAPESANIAQEGGHLIPTLLFGIPSSGSMALLLSGFILINIKPGLDMVTTHLELTYTIIWSLTIANVIGAVACVLLSPTVARLTTVPSAVIAPLMLVLIFFAASQTTHDWSDLITLVSIGVFSIYLRRFGWPRPAFMIGFVLSSQLENSIYRVVQIYQWSFLTRPVVIVLGLVILGSLIAALRFREVNHDLPADGIHAAISRRSQLTFYGLLLAASAFVLAETFQWEFATALFPRTIAIATLLLLLPTGYLMLRSKTADVIFFDTEREAFSQDVQPKSTEYYLMWIAGYLALIAVLGFVLGSLAFLYAFLRDRAELAHWKCVACCALVLAVLAGVSTALGTTYISGLLQMWVQLPWPFN